MVRRHANQKNKSKVREAKLKRKRINESRNEKPQIGIAPKTLTFWATLRILETCLKATNPSTAGFQNSESVRWGRATAGFLAGPVPPSSQRRAGETFRQIVSDLAGFVFETKTASTRGPKPLNKSFSTHDLPEQKAART